MSKFISAILLILLITISIQVRADDPDEARLVSGIKAISPAITQVRASSVRENARTKFKIQWMPALTLKKGLDAKQQQELAKSVAKFVVDFQGGVPTDGILGGVLAFFEGEGWTPELGQVIYKVAEDGSGKIAVWTEKNIIDKETNNVSCCDPGSLIGKISGGKVQ